jgi:exosortase K
MVEQIMNLDFEKEPNSGYINREHMILIAPSCAGINFLIIALCAAIFSFVHHFNDPWSKMAWILTAITGAFGLTLAVNTIRITGSVYLYGLNIYSGWVTPERIHRLEGIFLYSCFLCAYYRILSRSVRSLSEGGRAHEEKRKSGLLRYFQIFKYVPTNAVPLGWYLLIAIALPLANGAYVKEGPKFVEHSVVILSVCGVVLLSLFLIQWCNRWLARARLARTRE